MTALPGPQAGASARPCPVLTDLARSDCPVAWMRARLPDNAIPTGQDLPPLREKAIGWLSDPGVCIWFIPAIVWRTPSSPGVDDEWWSGLPGHYLDLRRDRWHLSHWLPLSGVNSHDAILAALRLALPIIEEDEADTRTGVTPAGEAVRDALCLAAPAREEGR